MANQKITDYNSLTGAGVDATADLLEIVDMSATTNKKILVEELAISVGATQAQQETATATKQVVNPSNQQFHPSSPKAWGTITAPTTVTVSYPAAGVSNTNPSTGVYVVTHGKTFSSINYVVNLTVRDASQTRIPAITAQDATTFTATFWNISGAPAAVAAFDYSCSGDLA